MKLGVTLYSLTNEFHSREYTLEQLLAEIARRGLGPGVEVVGFQSFRGFPRIEDAFAERFRALLAEHRLVPTCLGINADVAIRRDRLMSTEESVAYHEAQVLAAAKLGFPVARFQYAAGPEVIRRLIPLAERLDVKLGLEVHAPHGVSSPVVTAFREMYEKAPSPYLGFIPDFGASARAVPPGYLATLRAGGVSEQLIDLALDAWHAEGDANTRRAQFHQRASAAGARPEVLSALSVIFNILSRQDAGAWRELMPQVIHIHAKFYEFDAAGNEPAIPYEDLLPVFQEGGYSGFMSSEWEGSLYSNASGFEMLEQHRALFRRILRRRD